MTDQPFLTDVKTLRERARKHIEEGALTEGYGANRDNVVSRTYRPTDTGVRVEEQQGFPILPLLELEMRL